MRKSYRIKKPEDFKRVIKKRRSVANKYFILYRFENSDNQHFRLGLSVSKKVGKAHDRVWVKRRIRQSFLEFKPVIPNNLDILVIARPAAAHQSQRFIKQQLEHVLKLAYIIK